MTLLYRYNEWRDERADLSANEVGTYADAWADSDDTGCDLARELAEAYKGAVRAASNVIASWESGDLAAAVNDLRQVLMLDTTSSASRQHYIDTGRYLQEGEGQSPYEES